MPDNYVPKLSKREQLLLRDDIEAVLMELAEEVQKIGMKSCVLYQHRGDLDLEPVIDKNLDYKGLLPFSLELFKPARGLRLCANIYPDPNRKTLFWLEGDVQKHEKMRIIVELVLERCGLECCDHNPVRLK